MKRKILNFKVFVLMINSSMIHMLVCYVKSSKANPQGAANQFEMWLGESLCISTG